MLDEFPSEMRSRLSAANKQQPTSLSLEDVKKDSDEQSLSVKHPQIAISIGQNKEFNYTERNVNFSPQTVGLKKNFSVESESAELLQ